MGDPFGMAVAHGVASGIGGIRAAGDLVARMQVSKGMRLPEAKKYVAAKLGASEADIAKIPVHACVGMGVCGVPLTLTVPIDALTRASKALVDICRLDGL